MPVRIEGLKELRRALREAADASPREVTKALKEGAVTVTEKAKEYAPKQSGKLASSLKPFATQRSAGVRSRLVYAGVQEFAVEWTRSNPRRGRAASRGEKRLGAATGKGGDGTNVVHYTKDGPTPRFATKAVEELAPELTDATFDRLVEILRCHGWFEGGGL